jgi:hypothetical protein|tara:strand:- start:214 stop:672 length:459 start_codon:yes stop_codon:yes gene_type:complete
MASLLTSVQKAALQSAFDDVHDTFARDIYVFKEAKKIVISTDPNYNPIYDKNSSLSKTVTKEVQRKTFQARVMYNVDRAEPYLSAPEIDSQLKLKIPDGTVRIKIDQAGYNYVKGSKRIELDGRRFTIESDVRPHGLFEPTYYTFFLMPTED